MDLKKLRPTKSLFATPRLAAVEAHKRCRPHVPLEPVETLQPPSGKGSELWLGYYNDALLRGHPDPEKMADTALRSREKTLALAAARPAMKQAGTIPKPTETVALTKPKGRTVLHDAFRCKALTLEGRRCGFKATCADFCKKHAL